MAKNIAFFHANYLITYFHELMLDRVQIHLDNKDNVFTFSCEKTYPVCDMNFFHKKTECNVCVRKQNLGDNLLSGIKDSDQINLSAIELNDEEKNIVRNYKIGKDLSNNEIRNLAYEDFELGWGVLSSISNLYREPEPDLSHMWDVVEKHIHTTLSIYLYAKRFFRDNNIDLAYILNGRYAYERAFVSAAKATNTKFYCFERGAEFNSIRLVEGGGIHDKHKLTKDVLKTWDESRNPEKENIGREYYENRMSITKQSLEKDDIFKEKNLGFFTQAQIQDKLPENFDKSKKNVVIFNSSEDEFRSLDISWKMDLYENQNVATQTIFNDFANRDDINIYLRIHPNLAKLQTSNIKEIYDLDLHDNTFIIDGDSSVSTYALASHCDIVLVFGSSVGIESTFLRKPSILLGKAYYQYLDVCYIPKNHSEVINYIEHIPEPKPLENVIKVGYFWLNYGEKTQYFKAQDILNCTFKGENIHHLNLFGKIWRRGWQLPGFKHVLQPFEVAQSNTAYKKMLK